jgi:hypothetical protein
MHCKKAYLEARAESALQALAQHVDEGVGAGGAGCGCCSCARVGGGCCGRVGADDDDAGGEVHRLVCVLAGVEVAVAQQRAQDAQVSEEVEGVGRGFLLESRENGAESRLQERAAQQARRSHGARAQRSASGDGEDEGSARGCTLAQRLLRLLLIVAAAARGAAHAPRCAASGGRGRSRSSGAGARPRRDGVECARCNVDRGVCG